MSSLDYNSLNVSQYARATPLQLFNKFASFLVIPTKAMTKLRPLSTIFFSRYFHCNIIFSDWTAQFLFLSRPVSFTGLYTTTSHWNARPLFPTRLFAEALLLSGLPWLCLSVDSIATLSQCNSPLFSLYLTFIVVFTNFLELKLNFSRVKTLTILVNI